MSSTFRDKSLIDGNPAGAVLPVDMGGQDRSIQVGGPYGLPYLNEAGELPATMLPAGMTGGVVYKGTWDASTGNPPHLQPEKGWYYVVSANGATNLDGLTEWKVGDWAIFNGVQWQKVDNTEGTTGVPDAPIDGKRYLRKDAAWVELPDPPFVVEDYVGTARALTAADKNKLIRCTNAAAVTLTLDAGLPANWKCDVLQSGAGQVTIAGAAGVTVNAADAKTKTRVQYSVIGIARTAADTVAVYGDRA